MDSGFDFKAGTKEREVMAAYRKAIMIGALVLAQTLAWAGAGRTTLPLDGEWKIAEGAMDQIPETFDHTVSVPGLVDSAQPAFADVGFKSERREAFWYRRTFKVEGAVPAVAQIKTRQTLFGAKVILNGQVLGERAASFTPGYFDAAKALKGNGAENELSIRVGAFRDSVPAGIPTGWDFEKIRYIPGIFDSVELILSGTPHIVSVQAVPDINARSVGVQVVVRNTGATASPANITVAVREAKSGREVGQATTEAQELAPGKEVTLDLKAAISDCHLWSPDDPFLYELEVRTGADSFTTRFGMREFHFDPASRRAVLNGKPFFMRGSNVCIFRFTEDPERGDKPWREEWVRRLHKRFKEMHWDALRYCIGFPPEIWYQIADEEGFLIQDEFPIWHLDKKDDVPRTDELVKEYSEWMRERWNHPCVVIWDAQNETTTDQTGPAIQQVRGLDLSRRPWDNGWAPAMDPGDSHESHPYHFMNANFKLDMMAAASHDPGLRSEQVGQGNAIIVNEYGWLWLNRDGQPATLTADLYRNLLGTASKASDRFRLYARYLAAETEFWRAHRKCAAVLHFCGLGYSRPDGQTSDHFTDLEKLEYEPNFFEYVRDSFAPVGLMIDCWDAQAQIGVEKVVPIIVINDLEKPWAGAVRVRVTREGDAKPALEDTKPLQLVSFGDARVEFKISMPQTAGDYLIEAALIEDGSVNEKPVHSLRDVAVVSAEQIAAGSGLGRGKPVVASSVLSKEGQTYPAEAALDANMGTRWSSEFKDGEWLAVDLGRVETVARVVLSWEGAFASEYAIETSNDGQTWKEASLKKDGKGGTEEVRLSATEARWVRVRGIKRATPYGISLYEMQLFRR